jgi:osmotically-inducible protein OsmY
MRRGGWTAVLAGILMAGGISLAAQAMEPGGGSGTTGMGRVPGLGFIPVKDQNIQWGLEQRLSSDPITAGSKISVTSNNGIVTLDGQAPSQEVRARAVDMAHGMAGVLRVEDRIQVAGGGSAG